ncbi:hypothetical protein Rsub_11420 [Raphidocelis subcapitata]|uniref:Uncharacterized protein n=1 Tax=Raphidocelis subcapitata TaxID=307507 RepID=A0A2V0PMA6_9CHLO|nr:hypothetical protein Rsub_11420 [Raphidocelis subcapitata]|eukprot:GBF99213.1 hypothetical protein Rsub_11420 [Raphidocelis subcapitata]
MLATTALNRAAMRTACRPHGAPAAARRALAAPLPRRRARGKAVTVVAYRDAHREQLVEQVGRRALEGWFKGMSDTPAAAEPALDAYVDPNVRYRSDVVADVC